MTVFERFRHWVKRTLTLSDPALRNLFQDAQTHAGVNLNEHTALNLAAVWAAVRVISEDTATIPLPLYRRLDGGGKERAMDRKLYRLLHDQPNAEMTAVNFREALTAHVLVWGNAYAEIERNGLNEPLALWPLPPNRVIPERAARTNELIYRIKRDDGTDVILMPNDILHVPGLSFDGIKGYSVIQKARESLGVAAAAEQYAATFFGKGGRPGIVLEHPKGLSQEASDRIKADWKRLFGGPEASNEIAVLEEGMTLHDFGIPQRDMQFLDQRKFSVTEIARWFRIPPHKIMDLERATFSNIEHQAIDYVVSTLRPWLVRWEQELNRKLIPGLERNRFFFEHLIDGLLRGDALTRAQSLQVQFQNGALNPDEWRELENRNPLPNGQGKTYFVQGAMQTIEEAKKPKPDAALRPLELAQPGRNGEADDDDDEDERDRDRDLRIVREAIARVEAQVADIRVALEDPKPVDDIRRTAAHRDLFVDIFGRMVRREVKAIRRRLRRESNREAIFDWLADYYAKHKELVYESIRSPVSAYLAAVGDDADILDKAQSLSDRYVGDALEQLHNAEDIEALLIRWESDRARDIADSIVKGPTHAIR